MKPVCVSYESLELPSPLLQSPANYFSLGTGYILPWVWWCLARFIAGVPGKPGGCLEGMV